MHYLTVMQSSNDFKRCFFGFEVEAAWIDPLPKGRIISEENRHITVAFLGNVSFSKLQSKLIACPQFPLRLGPLGICDKLLFLPETSPHVVAAHIRWFDEKPIQTFQQVLRVWLEQHGYKIDPRDFLSHVTLARSPFDQKAWENAFSPFPLLVKAFHLYESLKCLHYQPLWGYTFISPIEEFEHTADIAFRIRGENKEQLFFHAQMALALKFPSLLEYLSKGYLPDNLDELIIQLNKEIAFADAEIGCPFKAISFHGEIEKDENGFLLWEMIADV